MTIELLFVEWWMIARTQKNFRSIFKKSCCEMLEGKDNFREDLFAKREELLFGRQSKCVKWHNKWQRACNEWMVYLLKSYLEGSAVIFHPLNVSLVLYRFLIPISEHYRCMCHVLLKGKIIRVLWHRKRRNKNNNKKKKVTIMSTSEDLSVIPTAANDIVSNFFHIINFSQIYNERLQLMSKRRT